MPKGDSVCLQLCLGESTLSSIPYSLDHGKCGLAKLSGTSQASSLDIADLKAQTSTSDLSSSLRYQLHFLHPVHIATTLLTFFVGMLLVMFIVYMVWFICSRCIEPINSLGHFSKLDPLQVQIQEEKFRSALGKSDCRIVIIIANNC